MVYDDLVTEILYLAAARFGLHVDPIEFPEALPAEALESRAEQVAAWDQPAQRRPLPKGNRRAARRRRK
jgi:hypothetical protein